MSKLRRRVPISEICLAAQSGPGYDRPEELERVTTAAFSKVSNIYINEKNKI